MRIMGRWKRNAFEWTKSKHGTKRTQKERKFTLEVHPNRICEYYMIGEAICNMTCPCPAPHLPSVKVHLIEQHDVPVWLLEHWPDMAMQVALATLTQSGGVQHATAVQPGVFRVFSPGAVVRKSPRCRGPMLCPFEGTRRTGKKRITAAPWSTCCFDRSHVMLSWGMMLTALSNVVRLVRFVSRTHTHTHPLEDTHTQAWVRVRYPQNKEKMEKKVTIGRRWYKDKWRDG